MTRTHSISASSLDRSDKSISAVQANDITIGRDILELLSSAMYVDPMTIYREYLQNAADAIDEAKQKGVLSESDEGAVELSIDGANRTVRIRDNGIGIPSRQFTRKMTALGASSKRGAAARGFRGVGRLAGLGYCQELIFRSRARGESNISELRWDCRRLKSALRSTESEADLRDVIVDVVTHHKTNGDDWPPHFFEVELKGIIRHKNDRLLSPEAVADYISQVAPVPFAPTFKFGAEIASALKANVPLGDLRVVISGLEEPVFRPFRNELDVGSESADSYTDVEFVHLTGMDGQPSAICWLLHHSYAGAIPQGSLVKGLRLRVGNIQVGDHLLLEELFTESRFSGWVVGEVHILDERIVPNGRRDHFEQNTHFNNLLNQIAPIARDLSRRCRTSSIKRKWLRDFDMQSAVAEEKIAIIAQGTLAAAKRTEFARGAERAIGAMEKIAKMDGLDLGPEDALAARVRATQKKLDKVLRAKLEESPLADLPTAKRRMYEQMFALIYECSTNRIAAKSLIDRILQKVT
ncbi:ATP-binding protein [Hyphomicrobium sp. NDB2Meth4]|uniref:ATP-binding protein n=1 Tax=Hyphomicrobium sp. NDB2Meth4 TaxID=1892846 RepID=UPI000930DC70|nr:ATP-binding protein [Hyphomicrobium sp. NDB2Meth4]